MSQSSFFPFTIPVENIPFDFSNAKNVDFENIPDILILPSNLPFILEKINDVLIINPKSLFFNNDYGTYTKIFVNSFDSIKAEVVYL
jgi:hypothetical protein